MKPLREIMYGLFWAIGCVGLIVGAFSLALVEGTVRASDPNPANSSETSNIPSEAPTNQGTKFASPTIPVVWTITKQAPPACTPPKNWVAYTIRSKDTLAKLSSEYNLSVNEIKDGNCLVQDKLIVGTIIYLPLKPTETPELTLSPAPTETAVNTSCSIPGGWVPYSVRSGDSLFSISIAQGISVWQLKSGNCLGQSDLILTGQILYVPNIIMPTSTIVSTPTKIKPTKIPTSIPPTAVTITEIVTETIIEPTTETVSETPPPAPKIIIP